MNLKQTAIVLHESFLLRRIWKDWCWIFSVGLPIAIGFFITLFFEAIDVILAGNLGASELAGVALGFSIVPLCFVLGLGFLVALNPTSGQLFGAKRYPELAHSFFNGLFFGFCIGFILLLIMQNVDLLLLALGRDPEIVAHANTYLVNLSWGMPFLFMALGLRNVLEGIGISRPYMLFALVALLFKLPLAYWWTFGAPDYVATDASLWSRITQAVVDFLHIIPAHNIAGAGFSTSVVNVFIFVCTLYYCLRSKRLIKLIGPQRFQWSGFKSMKALALLGAPIGLTMTAEVTLFGASALLISEFGTLSLAAHQVAINFGSLVFMIPLGFSVSISACVSQRIGQKDMQAASFCGWSGVGLIVCLMFLSASFIAAFAHEIADVYTNDAQVKAVAVKLLYVAAFFQIFDGLQVGVMGALRGYKDTQFAMYVSFFLYTCGGLLLAVLLGFYFGLGVIGIWYAFVTALFAASIVWILRLNYIVKRSLQP